MLNAKNLGLAGGLLWGSYMFIFTLANLFTGYGSMWGALMIDVYPGYEVTLPGSIVGFIWGFLDAFVGFYILGWLYNKFSGSTAPEHKL